MFRQRLIAPGPVETSGLVANALAQPQLHHRSPEAREIVLRARAGLQKIFAVPETWQPLILTASGTGAFEAALVSLLAPGARVLSVSNGKFGERWGIMAKALGFDVVTSTTEWGQSIAPSSMAELLKDNSVQALLITHSETSTGALNDLKEIARQARAVNPDIIIICDAITSLGVSELRPEEWALDAVISGSQKGVAGPPGLAFVALSPRAVSIANANPSRGFYFDLKRELKVQSQGETAFTPAINLIAALNAGLAPILADIETHGLERLWQEKRNLNDALLQAAIALGCTSFAEHVSPACVTLVPPKSITGRELVKALLARGARAQGGQDAIKESICRISFMGHYDRYDCLAFAGLLEDALKDCGANFVPGVGVAAAWKRLGNKN